MTFYLASYLIKQESAHVIWKHLESFVPEQDNLVQAVLKVIKRFILMNYKYYLKNGIRIIVILLNVTLSLK